MAENRRRALAAAGADPQRAVSLRQRHGDVVVEAGAVAGSYLDAATAWPEGDALVTSQPGLPLVAHGADCLTAALVARRRDAPRGRARGLARTRRAACSRPLPSASGRASPRPSGPVPGRAATPSARTSPRRCARASATTSSRTGAPTSQPAPAARSSARGAADVAVAGLCTICDAERFHSHRRDGAGSGRQAVIAYLGQRVSVELEVVRENLAGARAAIADAARRSGREPSAVELLAAVKYVAPEDMETLAAAGIALVGENRVEQLLAKQEVARDRFDWDFIGHLQSRKARDLVGRVRLVHSLSTLSAAERLDRSSETPVACLVEVNVAGEDSKEGLAPDALDEFLEAVAALRQHPRRGAHDDAAAGGGTRRPRGRRSRRCASSPSGSASAGRRSTRSAVSRWARARITPSPWRRARRSCASDRPSTAGRAYSLATHGSR